MQNVFSNFEVVEAVLTKMTSSIVQLRTYAEKILKTYMYVPYFRK